MFRPGSSQNQLDPIDIAALRPPFAPTDAATTWLFRLHRLGIRPGLESIAELLESMGRPQLAVPAIVVAGTNGKGSAATALAQLLQSGGLRVGLYTSPHLLRLHERIRVDGNPISEDELFALVSEFRGWIDHSRTTFFESLTALAFEHFRRSGCEVLVLEAGLGGRLDATNVARKVAVVLTSIGLDHQDLLGHSEDAIAREKLGLVEAGVPLLTMSLSPSILEVAAQRTATVGSELIELETSAVPTPRHSRSRRHRIAYRQIVTAALELCRRHDWPTPDLAAVAEVFRLRGRYDLRGTTPELLLDSAHNAHALVPLLEEWREEGEAGVVLWSSTEGKELSGVPEALVRSAEEVICVAPGWPRARSAESLRQLLLGHGALPERVRVEASVGRGLEVARSSARSRKGRVLVTGSNFLVAEALHCLGIDDVDEGLSPRWDAGLALRDEAREDLHPEGTESS